MTMTESNKTRSKALIEALKQPNGARFYRCALQVNPFAYHGRHAKQSQFQNEADYNAAIIEACRANYIEAIAVTDHYRISDSLGLVQAARAAGIFVFGGFEAASNDGVHFLCLYDPDKDSEPGANDRSAWGSRPHGTFAEWRQELHQADGVRARAGRHLHRCACRRRQRPAGDP